MPVTSITSHPETLSLRIEAEYPVPVERLWEAYVDPRQFERFWGPVGYPATFARHDVAPGGESRYFMTSPDGSQHHGWFRFLLVEPLALIEFEEGFSHDDGTVNEAMPSARMTFTFERTATGSRLHGHARFPSVEAMELLVGMGMPEGIRSAMTQTDDVLADRTSYAAELPTQAQLLSDTVVRVSRVLRGSVDQVWQAHHDPALMRRWFTGPEGFTLPVCDVALRVGEHYRYEWESADGAQRFGFVGEVLELAAPYRAVKTQVMIGMPGPGTRVEFTLSSLPGATLLILVLTYPSKAVRDMIVSPAMTASMETGYARLEREVLAVG